MFLMREVIRMTKWCFSTHLNKTITLSHCSGCWLELKQFQQMSTINTIECDSNLWQKLGHCLALQWLVALPAALPREASAVLHIAVLAMLNASITCSSQEEVNSYGWKNLKLLPEMKDLSLIKKNLWLCFWSEVKIIIFEFYSIIVQISSNTIRLLSTRSLIHVPWVCICL